VSNYTEQSYDCDIAYVFTASNFVFPKIYQIKSNQIKLFYSAPKSWPESWPT